MAVIVQGIGEDLESRGEPETPPLRCRLGLVRLAQRVELAHDFGLRCPR